MADSFYFFEKVDISIGGTAIVKNYYPANGYVVLYSFDGIRASNLTSGVTITGQSSGFSKTLTSWDYSTPENDDFYDNNFDIYAWESDVDLFIYTDDDKMIVMDDKADLPEEIADLQMDNGLVLR